MDISRPVDVLVATKSGTVPNGLEQCPWSIDVHLNTTDGWAKAANELLDLAAQNQRDALFVDDDVTFHKHSWCGVDRYYDVAEVFGFRLCTPGGGASAGWELPTPESTMVVPTPHREPRYLAHVTTSCIYLKATVPTSGLRFPVWGGAWYEDVAFTIDAWLRGHRVAYVGGDVDHKVGATKLQDPDGYRLNDINFAALKEWMLAADIPNNSSTTVLPGKVLIGSVPLEVVE